MADTTTVMAFPFPEGSDANDVPADMSTFVTSGTVTVEYEFHYEAA